MPGTWLNFRETKCLYNIRNDLISRDVTTGPGIIEQRANLLCDPLSSGGTRHPA